jgi:hypothetical protein
MSDLFGDATPVPASTPENAPLADKLRPAKLDEVIGQEHLTGPDGAIGRMVAAGKLSSMILWGPPGTGKTSIARLLADAVDMHYKPISAVFSGVADLKRAFAEAEAIAMANDSRHGLACGIFTRDGARQLRMARAVRAGIVWVNTYRAVSPIAAFGGVKGSGYGRESGFQAMADYTRPKTVWVNTSTAPMANPFVMR